MSLGVVRYCTKEGGSGFIANSALPWLSTFDITQQAPVYDQETAWLRTSRPGTYTNYSRFGPPYSIDGGIRPPYYPSAHDDNSGQPVPFDTSCGMGDLILRRSDVVAQLPSITGTARAGCDPINPCETEIESWIKDNPWLAAGLAAGAAILLFGGPK